MSYCVKKVFACVFILITSDEANRSALVLKVINVIRLDFYKVLQQLNFINLIPDMRSSNLAINDQICFTLALFIMP